MEFKISYNLFPARKLWTELLLFQILLVLVLFDTSQAKFGEKDLRSRRAENGENIRTHSCIHDQIIEQRRKRPGNKVFSVTPQVYHGSSTSSHLHRKGRELLEAFKYSSFMKGVNLPIRIYLNYDAVGHSHDRDCRNVGDIVKLGEPPAGSDLGRFLCNPLNDPPIYGDCWYNCTSDDLTGDDKRRRLQKV
nr:EGF-like domain, peptidase M8, leishmanolysin, Frizzled domain protein [Tanacetum cinerariifolium]